MLQRRSLRTRPDDFIRREDILNKIEKAFTQRDSDFPKQKKLRKERLERIAADMDGLLKKNKKEKKHLPWSEQIYLEADWLVKYTDDWPQADQRLNDFEANLTQKQPERLTQGEDGSWGPAVTAEYRKLEPTVDALQDRDLEPASLKRLRFMAHLKDPKRVIDALWRIQISDIAATGRNHRDELGALQTALSQLIFKDALRGLLRDNPILGSDVSPTLESSYLDFLRQAQHPRTGYWGPWYRFGDRLYAVQDLSFTFHVIQYRSGNVENWPQIIESTHKIKELTYPAGWKPRKGDQPFNDHNNYDVVSIFAHGWPHMTGDQKDRTRDAIKEMLTWCLTQSLMGNGFGGTADEQLENYYFGVRFLDRVGLWDAGKRFWSGRPPELPDGLEPARLAERLAKGFEPHNDGSEAADTVHSILAAAPFLARL
jgi:hypothetical protein